MLTDDFCLWLQTFLNSRDGQSLSCGETAEIQERLASVFAHAIDPTFGDADHLARLQKIHSGEWELSSQKGGLI